MSIIPGGGGVGDGPDMGLDAPGEPASPDGSAVEAVVRAEDPDEVAGPVGSDSDPVFGGVSRAEAAGSSRSGPCAWAKDG